MRENMPSKVKRELWFVEFDRNLSPTLKIKAKVDMAKVKKQCERLEAKMLLDEIRNAQRKVYSTEVLAVAHI